jgi:hypothetical protein
VGEAGAPDAEWIRKRIGELTGQEISRPPRILDDTTEFFPYRLMNLGAIYPWLPRPFTEILRRFAVGDCPRYGTVDEVADDLQAVIEGITAAAG